MDSIDYANKLVKEFGVDHTDVLKALDAEVDDLRADPFQGRKPGYAEALDEAYAHLWEWLTEGHTYTVQLTWESVRDFAHGHRKACVWAVLTSKAIAAAKAVRP